MKNLIFKILYFITVLAITGCKSVNQENEDQRHSSILSDSQWDFLEKLTAAEVEAYHAQKPILRDKTKEGHRTFGTFHPPAFIRNIFMTAGFSILEHIPGKRVHSTYISQDVWILLKK